MISLLLFHFHVFISVNVNGKAKDVPLFNLFLWLYVSQNKDTVVCRNIFETLHECTRTKVIIVHGIMASKLPPRT